MSEPFELGNTGLVQDVPLEGPITPDEIRRRLHDPTALRPDVNIFSSTPMASRVFPTTGGPSAKEILGSSFRLENDMAAVGQWAYRNYKQGGYEDDPDFEITPELIINTPFEFRPDLLTDVHSFEEFSFLLEWYNRELEDRKVLELAGGAGMATAMFAGLLSPVSLFSFGAGIKTASMLHGSLRGMKAGFAGMAVSESLLQFDQEFRPWQETAWGITGGTFLQGVLGSGGGALGYRHLRKGIEDIDILVGGRLDSAIADVNGKYYFRNKRVVDELQKYQDEAVTNREIPDLAAVRQIFKKYGDEVPEEELSGRLDIDGRVLISTEDMAKSRRIITGFDDSLSVKRTEELADAARKIPIRKAQLDENEAKLVDRLREENDPGSSQKAERETVETETGTWDPVEDARELGIEDPEAFVALSRRIDQAEKDGDLKTLDPVTGRELTASELMDILEAENPHLPLDDSRMGEEFQRRRGYTQEEIDDWNEWSRITKELHERGASIDELHGLTHLISKMKGGPNEAPKSKKTVGSTSDEFDANLRAKEQQGSSVVPVVRQASSKIRKGEGVIDESVDEIVPAYVEYDPVTGEALSIVIDPDGLKAKFDEKAWTKPKIEGVEPLPEGQFRTYQEWEDFVVAHERAHIDEPPRAKNETRGEYEQRMNEAALRDEAPTPAQKPKIEEGETAGKAESKDPAVKARAKDIDVIEEEMSFFNGIREELAELFGIKNPSVETMARISFLESKFIRLTTESRLSRLRNLYEDHGIDPSELDELAANRPKEPEPNPIDAEKLDTEAVERLRRNDRDLEHTKNCSKTTEI